MEQHPGLRIRVDRPDEDLIVITLGGELDMATTPTLIRAMNATGATQAAPEYRSPTPTTVEVRLADVWFVDSTGLAGLSWLGVNVPTVVLVDPSEHLRRVLKLTGFERLFEVRHSDPPAAPGT